MADIKVSQMGEVLVASDNDLLNLVSFDEQNQTYVSGKVKASTLKSYMVDDLEVSDLYDTTITTPTDDDGLVYDATAQKWENKPIVTQAQNKITGVHQFIYNRVTSPQVVGGLTITPNADGSFTVGAGTATSNDRLMISGKSVNSWNDAEQKLPIGKYYASCEGATNDVYLRVMVEENNQQTDEKSATDVAIEVNSAPSNMLAVIQILPGAIVPADGITLKPLLRLQSDSDKTITPYAKTNRQLTEDIKITTYTRTTDNTGECSIGSDSAYVPIGGSIVGTQNTHTGAISFRTASSDRNTYYAMFYSATSSSLNVVANKELTFIVVWVKKA